MKVDGRSLARRSTGRSSIRQDKLLRIFTDSLKEGLLVLDNQGHIVFWNEGAERIFGYAEREVLGRSAVSLFAPEEYLEKYEELFRAYLATGKSVIDQEAVEFVGLNQGRGDRSPGDNHLAHGPGG